MNQNHYFKQSGIGLPEHVQHLKEAGYFDRAIANDQYQFHVIYTSFPQK